MGPTYYIEEHTVEIERAIAEGADIREPIGLEFEVNRVKDMVRDGTLFAPQGPFSAWRNFWHGVKGALTCSGGMSLEDLNSPKELKQRFNQVPKNLDERLSEFREKIEEFNGKVMFVGNSSGKVVFISYQGHPSTWFIPPKYIDNSALEE